MKLISVAASPFARKARASIIELGLQDRVEIVDPGMVTPVSNNAGLNDINPLGMIPALVMDSGEALYDSSVICEYLNQLGEGSLYPSEIGRPLPRLTASFTGQWHFGFIGSDAI